MTDKKTLKPEGLTEAELDKIVGSGNWLEMISEQSSKSDKSKGLMGDATGSGI